MDTSWNFWGGVYREMTFLYILHDGEPLETKGPLKECRWTTSDVPVRLQGLRAS